MSDFPIPTASLPVLDIQHDTDPARDGGWARHIPHFGHALLFFTMALFSVVLCTGVAYPVAHIRLSAAEQHPGVGLAAQAVSYVLTLGIAWPVFSALWGLPFPRGIEWHGLAARRYVGIVAGAAVLLSVLAMGADSLVKQPSKDPFEQLMKTAGGAWGLTLFGAVLAPLMEEVAFRGFLLPALAIAYDWIMTERTPAGVARWRNTTMYSRQAWVVAAILSSAPFALLHAGQLSHAWGPVLVLYGVSLALSAVRIRTHSVACSTLCHMVYNATAFVWLLVLTGGYRHLEKLR